MSWHDIGSDSDEIWLESVLLGEVSVWVHGSVMLEEVPLVPFLLSPWSGSRDLWHGWDEDVLGVVGNGGEEWVLNNLVLTLGIWDEIVLVWGGNNGWNNSGGVKVNEVGVGAHF